MRVLVVEDERRLAEALIQILTEAKYEAEAVFDGEDGLAYARTGAYDLLLLDVMLPGLRGTEVARRLRAEHLRTPILMLTARTEVSDRVAGLDAGADDYLTKPFAPEELLARVRALLRRGEGGSGAGDELSAFDLTLSAATYTLSCGARSVRLNNKEFQVMRLLMTARDRYIPKEDLIVKVWGMESDAEDNNVEAYVSFLRKKLFYLKSRALIATLRRVGYRLEEDAPC